MWELIHNNEGLLPVSDNCHETWWSYVSEISDFSFFLHADNLSDTLKKLKITAVDRTEDSLEGCLDCLLQALAQNSKFHYVSNAKQKSQISSHLAIGM